MDRRQAAAPDRTIRSIARAHRRAPRIIAEVEAALRGETGSAVRSDPATGGLVFSVAIPVQRYKQVLGAVMLSTGSAEIDEELRTVRLELLRIFGVALLVTVLLSLYLAGTIARPIRRLAAAAERARGRGARVEIPDFTGRGDEIGDLSGSLREMTDALWQRMSAIESFAADVAHEIKNPLSSLRSAVETAARIEDPASSAAADGDHPRRCRAARPADHRHLRRLAARRRTEPPRARRRSTSRRCCGRSSTVDEATRSDDAPRLVVDLRRTRPSRCSVPGIESRLSQVFRNLIANAMSFSPPLRRDPADRAAPTAGRFWSPSRIRGPAFRTTS